MAYGNILVLRLSLGVRKVCQEDYSTSMGGKKTPHTSIVSPSIGNWSQSEWRKRRGFSSTIATSTTL